MKNTLLTSLVCSTLLTLLIIGGCGKDDDDKPEPDFACTTCAQTPEAKAANDNSSKGIYKGIIAGSTGVIKFDIQNNGTGVSAMLKIDGQEVPLTTTDAWVSGQQYNPVFTGTLNGQAVSLRLSVTPNGGSPSITSYSIPGHPAAFFQVTKETSDNLIKCFEGTASGTKDNGNSQSSTLNLVISSKTNEWSAVSKDDGSSSGSIVSGTISGATLTCNCGPTTTVAGTLKGDQIDGTYKGSDNHGTWIAKRTM